MLEAQVEGFSTVGVSVITVEVSRPPSSGKLIVSPDAGEAIATQFMLTTQDWVSDELPLRAPAFFLGLKLFRSFMSTGNAYTHSAGPSSSSSQVLSKI